MERESSEEASDTSADYRNAERLRAISFHSFGERLNGFMEPQFWVNEGGGLSILQKI
jgi:hypothetical protein